MASSATLKSTKMHSKNAFGVMKGQRKDPAQEESEVEDSGSEEGSLSDVSMASEEDSAASKSNNDNSDVEEDTVDEDTSDEEMDRLSIDDNVEGDDWMAVDGDETDSDSSSASNEESATIEDDVKTPQGDPKLHGNAGWADAMAKILRTSKPKGKKSIVLAKAKKLSQISISKKPEDTKQDYGFEIDGKEEDIKPKLEELDVKPDATELKTKIRRRDQLAEAKVKPSVVGRERERALSKIATKGVVQLFNAVREQQKDIKSKLKQANGSIRKEEKVLKSIDKRAFLDVLMGNARSERVEDLVAKKEEEVVKTEEPATWNVLRDNYLTGSNLKDWDKSGEIKVESDIDEVELN